MRTPLILTGCLIAAPGVLAGERPAPASPDEVRAIVAEMLSDAETRTSLLQTGAGAGHDGRFFMASPDGNFRLNVSGQLQFRYTMNFRDDDTGDDEDAPDVDDFTPGFTTPRTKLAFDGHIFEPSLFYRVQGAFDRDGGTFELEDAYAGYQFENGLIVLWGQLRMPVLWEDIVKERYSLAVDQSVVNAVFRQDRSQGVWLHKQEESWRFWAGFSDGIRSENTDFDEDTADWALTARVETKLDGEWGQFDSFSSPQGSEQATKLALAAHYQETDDAPVTGDLNLLAWTGDVMLEGDGWNAFAAIVGLYTDLDTGNFHDFGFVAQGGVFVTETIEPFVRYDVVLPDGDRDGDDAFNTVTAGLNYYMHGHAAKFTADIQWFLDDTAGNDLVSGIAGTSVGDGIGLLPSNDGDQVAVRLQFQILF